ncbi:hypothetical protein VCHA53O466_50253 [Vibrio chagasii]|nr:hypothetical protein VCHA53O466_50253 [Vibrio chagasii]
MKEGQNFSLSCYKPTDDDWCGSHTMDSDKNQMLVHIHLFGMYTFDHIHYEMLEEIEDEYESEEAFDKDHGIWKWVISASGNDDLAIEVQYTDGDKALSDFHNLLKLDKVNFSDIHSLES